MQPNKGIFTQIPVVFLDTCDLPEAQQMLFLRLCRETRGGTTWQGSIRKLAKIGRVSTGTAFNATRKLAEAGLFTITELPNEKNNADSMILHIKINELWALNVYYCAGNPVEKWKVFPIRLAQGVQKMNTPTIEDCSKNEQGGVQKMNTSQAQRCSKNERGVFNSQAQSGDIESKYIDTIENSSSREKDAATASHTTPSEKKNNKIVSIENQKTKRAQRSQPPQVVLTSEEQTVYDLYCTLFHVITNKPPLSEKVKEQCSILAPHVKTQEDIISIDKYARAHTKGHPQKMHLGNLVTNLDGWILEVKQATTPVQDTSSQEEEPLNETQEERTARKLQEHKERWMRQNPVVFWTTTGKMDMIANPQNYPLEDLRTWRDMPVEDAVNKYGMNWRKYGNIPSRRNNLLSRIAVLTSQTVSA